MWIWLNVWVVVQTEVDFFGGYHEEQGTYCGRKRGLATAEWIWTAVRLKPPLQVSCCAIEQDFNLNSFFKEKFMKLEEFVQLL